MSPKHLLIDTPEDGIRRIAFNRPEKRNALIQAMKLELDAALDDALGDETVRVLVLTGAGGSFSAGGDIDAMAAGDTSALGASLDQSHAMIRKLVCGPKPIVTAVEGPAFGAGLGLALMGDTVVCGEGARFGLAFFRLGLVPDFGVFYSLTRRIGVARARQAIMRAKTFSGREAYDMGLADELAPDSQVQEQALSLATELAAMSPVAFAVTRQALADHPTDLETSLTIEKQGQLTCLHSPEHREGVAAFLAKRAPNFAAARGKNSGKVAN